MLYEVYMDDKNHLDSIGPDYDHTINREVVLVCDGDKKTYITWTKQYEIGHFETSRFHNPAESIVDMSAHGLWAGLIGKEISIEYLVSDSHTLKIYSNDGAEVFVSDYENGCFDTDHVHISTKVPGEADI